MKVRMEKKEEVSGEVVAGERRAWKMSVERREEESL